MLNNPSTLKGSCLSDRDEIDRCTEEFQCFLNDGLRPALDDFLPFGPAAATVLIELVHVELEFRLKHGEMARVEEYLARYPRLSEDAQVIVELAMAEYAFRRRGEPELEGEEFLQRFPAHRDDLAARLAEVENESQELDRTLPHSQVDAKEAPYAGASGWSDLPRLPGYEIFSELGCGAMGVVYKARHLALNRIVALKMLHVSRQSDSEPRRRFRTEVETIARLQHPNIVQVYDVGEHNGWPFFTMEYLDGGSLAELCRGQAQAPRRAAEWVETLARAMHAVHAKGIVHRDLKPSNIMLASGGCKPPVAASTGGLHPSLADWILKIADFGLAHQQSSDLTATGQVLGTPSYMAPEQAAGKARQVGPTADTYALGALLYELLTGRLPFRGETAMEVIRQVQDSDPLSPRRLEPYVPRDLETICLKCLRKEPSQRYGSAGELADDLRRYLRGESILARPPTWPERGVRWLRRRPAVAVLLAVAVFAAVAVPLALLGHDLRLQQALQREHLAREQAEEAKDLARRKEAEVRTALYAADLRLANRLFKFGDVFQIPRLLEPYRAMEGKDDDPRGFEWAYLQRHSREARPALAAHNGPLHLLAYSPDGRYLVSGGVVGRGNGLRIWDLATGRSILRQPLFRNGFGDDRKMSALAANGSLLVGATKSRIVTAWDFASRNTRFQIPLSDNAVHLALSSDGRWLAVNEYHSTGVWDCASGRKQSSLATPPTAWLLFEPSGKRLLAVSSDASFSGLQWWDAAGGALLEQLPYPSGIHSASFSPRGSFLLLIGGDSRAAIWSAAERVPLFWSDQIGPVRSLAVSPDEQMLAAGDEEGRVCLWDIRAGRLRGQYRWQPNAIVQLAFTPDNRTLAAATAEGQVHPLDTDVCHVPDRLQTCLTIDGPLAWSPDGQTIAAAEWGGTVRLYDSRTAVTRSILRCPFQDVCQLAFSPDGRTLAVACWEEKIIRLWNAADGQSRGTTTRQLSPIRNMAFSPDGRLASGDGKTIRFWDGQRGTALHSLETDQLIQAFAFLPDGRLVLADNSALQIWEVPNNDSSPRKKSPSTKVDSAILHLAVSRNGRLVAAVHADDTVRLWRVSPEGQLTAEADKLTWPANQRPISSLQFCSDNRSLLAIGRRWGLFCALPNSRSQDILQGAVCRGVLSPDDRTLATTGGDGILRLWDVAAWRVRQPSGQALNRVSSLVFSDDGRTLITAGRASSLLIRNRKLWTAESAPLRSTAESLRFWDAASGRELPPDAPGQETMALPYLVAQSPDGRLLAAGACDGSVRIWDGKQRRWATRLFVSAAAERRARIVEFGRKLTTEVNPNYNDLAEAISALAFSRDGRRLAAAGRWGSIRVWDAEDGKEIGYWQSAAEGTAWLAFTPDGDALAGSRGGQVCLWDAQTGRVLTSLGAPNDSPIHCGVFAPDKPGAPAKGAILALGSSDGALCFWEPGSGEVKRLSEGHQNRVTCLAFSSDGKTLASGSWDHTVRLWNLAAGREVALLEGHKGRVNAVAFSPDGQTLASGGEVQDDLGEVLLWR